jgi:hypothetical protein
MQKLLRNIFANLANLLCRVLINFGHAFFASWEQTMPLSKHVSFNCSNHSISKTDASKGSRV